MASREAHPLVNLGSGRAWAWFWALMAGQFVLHIPLVLFTPLGGSLRYLNTISVLALVLSCMAAFQASLGMRKADPDDPL